MPDEENERQSSGRRDYDHDETKADAVVVAVLKTEFKNFVETKKDRDKEVDVKFSDLRDAVRDLKNEINSRLDGLNNLMGDHVRATNAAILAHNIADEVRFGELAWIVWIKDHVKLLAIWGCVGLILASMLGNFGAMGAKLLLSWISFVLGKV